MPLYEYQCEDCGVRFERVQHVVDDPVKICPDCGGPVRRLIHPVGIVFKGSGFYVTDNRAKNSSSHKASSEISSSKSPSSETPSSSSSAEKSSSSESKSESGGSKEIRRTNRKVQKQGQKLAYWNQRCANCKKPLQKGQTAYQRKAEFDLKFVVKGSGQETHGVPAALALRHVVKNIKAFGIHGHYRSGSLILAWSALLKYQSFLEDSVRLQLSKATDTWSGGVNTDSNSNIQNLKTP